MISLGKGPLNFKSLNSLGNLSKINLTILGVKQRIQLVVHLSID